MVVKKVLSEPGMHIKQNTLMNKYNILLVRKRISAKIQQQKNKNARILYKNDPNTFTISFVFDLLGTVLYGC